jgi:hypothetical protein
MRRRLIVKSFPGISVNAVNRQIWAALTAIMILKRLQIISKLNWSFSNLINLLRLNISTYNDIYRWINERRYAM